MLNNIIELADGSQMEGKIGYGGHDIAIYGSKKVITGHLNKFMNPAKTETITFYYGAYKDVYKGFDTFEYMERRDDGRIIVRLRGDNTSIESKVPTVPEEYLPKE